MGSPRQVENQISLVNCDFALALRAERLRADDPSLFEPAAAQHGGGASRQPGGLFGDRQEWRTAPLWGIGLRRVVNGHNFLLHDGRARGVEEAILWHGGEGEAARDAFAELTETEREALRAVLKAL